MRQFESDDHPGKPKILFIGNPYSSHVHGWINLVAGGEFNVRLFACTDGYPPAEWKVRTYLITKSPPEDLDPEWRQSWWPVPEEWYGYFRRNSIFQSLKTLAYRVAGMGKPSRPQMREPHLARLREIRPGLIPAKKPTSRTPTAEEWLATVIRSWQPDIIHTIGLDEGTRFYADARSAFQLEAHGHWIIKIFGGSDLAFKIFDLEKLRMISQWFAEAAHVLFDNMYYPNLLIERRLLAADKVCPLTPVPGSGGVDIDRLALRWDKPVSQRRVIVWPKSYESIWSKAIPVLFALKNVWSQIQPCEVYMLATNPEIKMWLSTLPQDMRSRIHTYEGVARDRVLDIMLKSRLMLAPSLVDGVPNILYEAMACGALPIVSPIPTIQSVVDENNVLFADNLDQPGLERAILRAMTDGKLVDTYAERNLEQVRQLADAGQIQEKAIAYYRSLVG